MNRAIKDHLYGQVARLGKALASPKRLELLELLCQGEKNVETLAKQAGISVKLASAHLRVLKQSCLVESRRDGKNMHYGLASESVADLWVLLRSHAEERLVELQLALSSLVQHPHEMQACQGAELLEKARAGEVIVLDVRPADEFAQSHLPHAVSMPLSELRQRLAELPPGTPVVAYCRGPFCLMSHDAVALLQSQGYTAHHLPDGVAEWRARGLPLNT